MGVRFGQAGRLVIATNIPTPYRLAFFSVLSEVLAERGLGFEVLYYAATEPNRSWSMDLRAQPYPWRILPGLHPRLPGLYPHINPTLPWAVRRARPTWLLVAGAWNTPSAMLAASRTATGPGVRLFWSEGHARAVLHPTGAVAALRRIVLGRFDGFAVPNQASETFVLAEIERAVPCLRLPNTVEEDFYLTLPASREGLRDELGIEASDVVLLCVARLEERKGVEELASAVAALPEPLRGKVLLVFAGDGPARGRVEAAARSVRLRMLGHVRPEQVRAWLHAADLFVLPSKIDPNPLSAIEAAFAGLPLVMSARAGNTPDLVVEGQSGWCLPEPEPRSMAAVLAGAIAAPDAVRRAAGLRARELAVAGFSRRGAAVRFVDDLLTTFPLAGGRDAPTSAAIGR